MKEPTTELIQKGKELYTTNCASCHNETGAGGGPASVGMNPAPRNFTSTDGWKNGRTLSGIYTTLEEGVEGGSMISYNFLTPRDRISLGHYIRKEFMQNPPQDSEDDLVALNSIYNLSLGMEIPAQISVVAAIEIISSENSHKENKLDEVMRTISNDRNKYPVTLFEFIVDNERLALSSLINSNNWKASDQTFLEFVSLNVNQNGFNSKVFDLTESDRNLLFSYLKQIL
jgi:hypothetical protein